MNTRTKLFYALCFVGFVVVMSGCGGSTDTTPPQGQVGRLLQGPVAGATVYADNVSGGVRFTLDAAEIFTTTNSSGDFTLPSVPSYNYILVSTGGTDRLTNQPGIMMIAPAGSANVTPLTTLVALDTTGTVRATIEALGGDYDEDISISATPAMLNLSKSIETVIQVLTATVKDSVGTATISATQMASVQIQAMQSISATIASSTANLAAPANLTATMRTAVTTAATNIASTNTNIVIPAATAAAIATSSVSAATTAVLGAAAVGSATAANTTSTLAESSVITTATAATLTAAVTTAATMASVTTTVTATPISYTPPTIPVTTNTTVNQTGSTGGNSTF